MRFETLDMRVRGEKAKVKSENLLLKIHAA
jgi:hypothetical protein